MDSFFCLAFFVVVFFCLGIKGKGTRQKPTKYEELPARMGDSSVKIREGNYFESFLENHFRVGTCR